MTMKLLQWFKDSFFEDWSPSAEDLARHYREMSDAAFRRFDPSGLTPIARACYEAEVKFRTANTRPAENSRIV